MVTNPYANINDGKMEMLYMSNTAEMGLGGMGRMLKSGADGVGPAYNSSFDIHRGSDFRVEKIGNPDEESLTLIDGEDWAFKKFVKASTVREGLEVFFDAETFFREKEAFVSK
jgi:hypothetical protein